MKAANGMVVAMHYTLTNDGGEVLDSSRDSEPLAYLPPRPQHHPPRRGAARGGGAGQHEGGGSLARGV